MLSIGTIYFGQAQAIEPGRTPARVTPKRSGRGKSEPPDPVKIRVSAVALEIALEVLFRDKLRFLRVPVRADKILAVAPMVFDPVAAQVSHHTQ